MWHSFRLQFVNQNIWALGVCVCKLNAYTSLAIFIKVLHNFYQFSMEGMLFNYLFFVDVVVVVVRSQEIINFKLTIKWHKTENNTDSYRICLAFALSVTVIENDFLK